VTGEITTYSSLPDLIRPSIFLAKEIDHRLAALRAGPVTTMKACGDRRAASIAVIPGRRHGSAFASVR
jgi:hypothetical protein